MERLPARAVYEALDSILQVDHVEVDEQTERPAAKFEVGDDLGLMNKADWVHGLDFYDDKVFDQEVHAISDFKFDAVINDRKPDLAYGPDTCFAEFVMQASLVGAFQQTGAELRMHLHRRRNHPMAYFMRG